MSSIQAPKLTAAEKARVESNKRKAILLKKSRITKRSHKDLTDDVESKIKRAPIERDTGAGFFLEESNEITSSNKVTKQAVLTITHEPGPVIEVENLFCEECSKEFLDSYLYSKFNHPICDKCRDEDKHTLITKTDAKNNYLLKDEDFDKREPALKYILRKNPHNPKWGDMKLYLHSQIWTRVLEVWGNEEKLQEAKKERDKNREKSKHKKFDKKLKELRMSVRSSLWRKDLSSHQHEYGEESYDEEKDIYSKTCTTCDHVWHYEKM